MNYEQLFENLFYIFGSWALIHGSYFLSRVNIRTHEFKSRWERIRYAVRQFVLGCGAMGFVLGYGAFAFVGDDFFFTPVGITQAVLVIGIPVAAGVVSGLTSSFIVPEQPSSQSSNALQPLDSASEHERL